MIQRSCSSIRPATEHLRHKTLNDDVSEEEKGRRLKEIIALQEGISHEINQGLIGETVEVLVEGRIAAGSGQIPRKDRRLQNNCVSEGEFTGRRTRARES